MKIFKQFPYECKISRNIDLLQLSDSDFPIEDGGDYIRDKNGEIMYGVPDYIKASSPASERLIKIDVHNGECDVTEASASSSSVVLGSKFLISLPLVDPIRINRGDIFETESFGFRINGKVLALFPSQLGLKLYISDEDN